MRSLPVLEILQVYYCLTIEVLFIMLSAVLERPGFLPLLVQLLLLTIERAPLLAC